MAKKSKSQLYKELARSGGSTQDFRDLYYKLKEKEGVLKIMPTDDLMEEILSRYDEKKDGGRIGYQEGGGIINSIQNIIGQGLDYGSDASKYILGLATGIPGLGLGIGALQNLSNKTFSNLPIGDQLFITEQMGTTDDNKDKYGYNIRSMFGNYGDLVTRRAQMASERQRKGLEQRAIDDYYTKLEAEKLAAEAEAQRRAATLTSQMAESNRQSGTGGYQSSWGGVDSFMSGSGTAADMGSFADGGRIGYVGGGLATTQDFANALKSVSAGTTYQQQTQAKEYARNEAANELRAAIQGGGIDSFLGGAGLSNYRSMFPNDRAGTNRQGDFTGTYNARKEQLLDALMNKKLQFTSYAPPPPPTDSLTGMLESQMLPNMADGSMKSLAEQNAIRDRVLAAQKAQEESYYLTDPISGKKYTSQDEAINDLGLVTYNQRFADGGLATLFSMKR